MRGFIHSNTFKILLIIVLTMLCLIGLSKNLGDVSLANAFGFISTPMMQTVAEISNDDKTMLSNMSREELEDYCANMISENAGLREQLLSYYDLKTQNELYEEALNLLKQKPELEIVPANVTGIDPSEVFNKFSIDIGSNDGIKLGDCVITAQGLVGVVSQVNGSYSFVTTILSPEISIGATAKEFNENGVVCGNVDAVINGYVKMEYLEKNTQIKKDTVITTSGSSGNFPANLIIGKVVLLGSEKDSASLYAYIEPYIDMKNITQVFVVTSFDKEVTLDPEVQDDGLNGGDTNNDNSQE